MPCKIEKYRLEDRTLVLDAEGKTTLEIAEVLTKELEGLATISQPTVSRWLKKTRKDRKNAAQPILDKYLGETLPNDLKILDELLKKYLAISRNTVAGEIVGENSQKYDLKTQMAAEDRITHIIGMKLRFVGIDPGGEDFDSVHPVDLAQYRTDADKLKKKMKAEK